MRVSENCKILCRLDNDASQIKAFRSKIDEDYYVNMLLDDLPALTKQYNDMSSGHYHFSRGYKLGYKYQTDVEGWAIYNHLRFIIKYNPEDVPEGSFRVVGFEVEPYSVKHEYSTWDDEKTVLQTCGDANPVDSTKQIQDLATPGKIVWTYDVLWEESAVKWTNRWDLYFQESNPDDNVHWFAIINSFMIVVFLSAMVAMIMVRTLHKDISKYNEDRTEDMAEETGWKLVHGDVFRPPLQQPMLLSIIVGSGVQLCAMTVALMAFAVLGFLSPANSGGLTTALLVIYVFMGSYAGYYSARFYKLFQGKEWKLNTLLTSLFLPGCIFGSFFILNLFVWHEGSSSAVPFVWLLSLLLMWFCVSVPLVFVGSYFGFKKDVITTPLRFNHIPRVIPPQPFFMNPVLCVLAGGILPFGAIFIEVFFIMTSIWLNQIYYVFGFLLLVLIILVVTTAEITIVLTYFQLVSEDYDWWWRSFLSSASSGLYLFAYSIMYYHTKLEMVRLTSALMYFGYMVMACAVFAIVTGTVGFIATFLFIRVIYGSIKVD